MAISNAMDIIQAHQRSRPGVAEAMKAIRGAFKNRSIEKGVSTYREKVECYQRGFLNQILQARFVEEGTNEDEIEVLAKYLWQAYEVVPFYFKNMFIAALFRRIEQYEVFIDEQIEKILGSYEISSMYGSKKNATYDTDIWRLLGDHYESILANGELEVIKGEICHLVAEVLPHINMCIDINGEFNELIYQELMNSHTSSNLTRTNETDLDLKDSLLQRCVTLSAEVTNDPDRGEIITLKMAKNAYHDEINTDPNLNEKDAEMTVDVPRGRMNYLAEVDRAFSFNRRIQQQMRERNNRSTQPIDTTEIVAREQEAILQELEDRINNTPTLLGIGFWVVNQIPGESGNYQADPEMNDEIVKGVVKTKALKITDSLRDKVRELESKIDRAMEILGYYQSGDITEEQAREYVSRLGVVLEFDFKNFLGEQQNPGIKWGAKPFNPADFEETERNADIVLPDNIDTEPVFYVTSSE